MAGHTLGPWRWEINERFKSIQLVGGRPQFDLTIIQPARWGLNSATLLIRDTEHDGLNLLHKAHDRRDWIVPFEGRAHHADWCANVSHPDLCLISAAPDLLDALKEILPMAERGAEQCGHDGFCGPEQSCDCACMAAYYDSVSLAKARAAIAKAEGRE